MIVRNRSWPLGAGERKGTMDGASVTERATMQRCDDSIPAVSQICSLIFLPSKSIVRILLHSAGVRVSHQHHSANCFSSRVCGIQSKEAERTTHKSMPIVVMNDGVHASSQNRRSKQDLPTPGGSGKGHERACREGVQASESANEFFTSDVTAVDRPVAQTASGVLRKRIWWKRCCIHRDFRRR